MRVFDFVEAIQYRTKAEEKQLFQNQNGSVKVSSPTVKFYVMNF